MAGACERRSTRALGAADHPLTHYLRSRSRQRSRLRPRPRPRLRPCSRPHPRSRSRSRPRSRLPPPRSSTAPGRGHGHTIARSRQWNGTTSPKASMSVPTVATARPPTRARVRRGGLVSTAAPLCATRWACVWVGGGRDEVLSRRFEAGCACVRRTHISPLVSSVGLPGPNPMLPLTLTLDSSANPDSSRNL